MLLKNFPNNLLGEVCFFRQFLGLLEQRLFYEGVNHFVFLDWIQPNDLSFNIATCTSTLSKIVDSFQAVRAILFDLQVNNSPVGRRMPESRHVPLCVIDQDLR